MWISYIDGESGGWGTIFFDVTISGFEDSAYSFILGEYAAKCGDRIFRRESVWLHSAFLQECPCQPERPLSSGLTKNNRFEIKMMRWQRSRQTVHVDLLPWVRSDIKTSFVQKWSDLGTLSGCERWVVGQQAASKCQSSSLHKRKRMKQFNACRRNPFKPFSREPAWFFERTRSWSIWSDPVWDWRMHMHIQCGEGPKAESCRYREQSSPSRSNQIVICIGTNWLVDGCTRTNWGLSNHACSRLYQMNIIIETRR